MEESLIITIYTDNEDYLAHTHTLNMGKHKHIIQKNTRIFTDMHIQTLIHPVICTPT